ncbi:MAG: ribosomal protein S18-alanine N-acetyltransferase [Gammaproteobacteria bacterium]|nr:ribosomal protein S18-alanine N-acetyltransferase [Gammaproteobacteria bacterium]
MSRDFIEVGLRWQWQPERVIHHIRCADSMVLVARTGKRLIGFAIMQFYWEHAHLLLLAVRPSYRRLGLGRRLVEWLEKSARTAGIATVYLEVRTHNQRAQGFYRALGYSDLQRMPGYYQGRESALRMAHDLRVAPGGDGKTEFHVK